MRERVREQRVRGGHTRIRRVHHGGRQAEHARWTGCAHDVAGQWVRCVRRTALGHVREVHLYSSIADARGESRHRILLVAGFTATCAPVVLPVVPRTGDVLTVQGARVERATGVRADTIDDAGHTIAQRDRQSAGAKRHRVHEAIGKVRGVTEVVPARVERIIAIRHAFSTLAANMVRVMSRHKRA